MLPLSPPARFGHVPQYLFLDRDGSEVGVIRSDRTDWEAGSTVQRETGLYRVIEVVVPVLEDIDGIVAYVIVEPVSPDQS